jgi:prolyl oligopeptidase
VVSAEAQLTERYLSEIPQRPRIEKRIAQLYDFEKTGIPFQEAGRYFYTHNSGSREQDMLLTATRLDERG